MAITRTDKFSNQDSTNQQNFTTASLTATANKLYILGVLTYDGTGLTVSVTGGGLTWDSIAQTTSTGGVRMSVFRALSASPGAGAALTIDAGGTVSGCAWDVQEFDGIDTSGSNGAGAIAQSKVNDNTGTSLTVTFDSAIGGSNAVYAALGHDIQQAGTPGGSYGTTNEQQLVTEGVTFNGIYLLPGTTTPSVSWAGSTDNAGVAVEIKDGSVVLNTQQRIASLFIPLVAA